QDDRGGVGERGGAALSARAPRRGDRGRGHRRAAQLRVGRGRSAPPHEQSRLALGARARMSGGATCPACAKAVDPLRAGRVAIFGETFSYFCDAQCRERFVAPAAAAPAPSIKVEASARHAPESARPSLPSLPAPSEPPREPSVSVWEMGSRLLLATM